MLRLKIYTNLYDLNLYNLYKYIQIYANFSVVKYNRTNNRIYFSHFK